MSTFDNLTTTEQTHILNIVKDTFQTNTGETYMTNQAAEDIYALTESQIISEILAKPESREQFLKQLNYLAGEKRKINQSQEVLKDDVKATSESFEIGVSTINKVVTALAKDTVNEELEKVSTLADLFQVVQEQV